MFYVYFDNETRDIISVTNEKTSNTYSYVEKQRNEVEDFLQGTKNFLDYKFDKDFNFVIKNKQTKDVVSNSFVEIGVKDNCDLKITHNTKWIFEIDKSINNIQGELFFAVTKKNNPNMLIRTILFNSQQAITGYTIDFKYKEEKDIKNISIWAINPPYKTAGLTIK